MASSLLPSTLVLLSLLSAVAALDGFTVELLHRDSPNSPYHNPDATPLDRLRAATQRTISRSKSLSSTNGSTFQSTVMSGGFEYLMTLSLGTPATKFLLIADTGSDITWTQCTPCTHCFKPNTSPFNPAKSSTYQTISCQSSVCRGLSELNEASCSDTETTCHFNVLYGDQSTTSGLLSYETFTFESANDKAPAVSFPEMVFGCAHTADGNFGNKTSGLVGLGRGPSSLITQLNSTIGGKFSYCLVPDTNLQTATSVLNFGNRAVVGGRGVVSTPLLTGPYPTFYYVNLEEIVIGNGEQTVVVNRGSDYDDSSPGQGNMIVDSGTTLTLLDQDTFEELKTKLSAIVKAPQVTSDQLQLCFNSTTMKLGDIPEMTFKFTGAAVNLSPRNTFLKVAEGVLCLAMLPSFDQSIYGNIAQQDFHVGYDLQAKKLSFAPADCANL